MKNANIEEKIIKKIDEEIEITKQTLKKFEKQPNIKRTIQREQLKKIYGMLDVLVIVTGKEYCITENGIKERIKN